MQTAIRSGGLDAGRLASFHKLGREMAAERRRSDPLAAREARRAWHHQAKIARRQATRPPW